MKKLMFLVAVSVAYFNATSISSYSANLGYAYESNVQNHVNLEADFKAEEGGHRLFLSDEYYEITDGDLLYWIYRDRAVVRSNYEESAGGARILKASGDVIIPSEINGVPVTGVFGFSGAQELTSVTLPDTVTTIAANAFYGCTSLKTINIPESVTFIGEEAFIETPWLENLRKDSPLVIVNNILVDGHTCEGDVVIPDTVTNIADHAFINCKNIKSVSIPDSISYIGREAFRGTAWLESITDENGLAITNGFLLDGKKSKGDVVIPNTVKVITGHAFSETVLSELTSVTIPKSVKTIEGYAFYNCPKLASIIIFDPDCEIKGISAFDRAADYDSEVTAFDGTVYGYDGSTAQAYAEKYGYKFESLGEAPSEELTTDVDGNTRGDANLDGQVNIADAVLVMQVATNPDKYAQDKSEFSITAQGEINADVDGKAGLTNADALLIQKFKLGLINKF